MIKAVLIDLDDTLIISQTPALFSAYLHTLGEYASRFGTPEQVAAQIMGAYQAAVAEYNPLRTLEERFFDHFRAATGESDPALPVYFDAFYHQQYPPLLERYVRPQPGSEDLLRQLARGPYQMVVATNPGLPRIAIEHRLRQGGIDPNEWPWALITSLETMHFGKPQPEYYEEILLRLDVEASEALMVGDDWENDIAPAAAAGLHTYWVGQPDRAVPVGELRPDGIGTFEQFVLKVSSGWLDRLDSRPVTRSALIQRLAAFPAGVAAVVEGHTSEVLECGPSSQEWSARDIICHLRDHDIEEDRARLQRILAEDTPFLSANYDPWAHAHQYRETSVDEALEQFVHFRAGMVSWLQSLPADVWSRAARHAIFGPTSFEEMVRFATEHDRTHLRQIRAAIAYALTVCGPDPQPDGR